VSTALDDVLAHLGYAHRPQQDALFAHLMTIDGGGVIAQAGTGTGKSIAVLAAAAELAEVHGLPSLVVCPTNILLDQYIETDAPGVEASLGVRVRALKGRNHYLCASAPGWLVARDPRAAHALAERLNDRSKVQETLDTYYGCPGSDECDPDGVCHYRMAKERLQDADIIITNAHLLIIDAQLKAASEDGPRIFPDLGAIFVDEAHALEEVARGFTESSINLATVDSMGHYGAPLVALMRTWERQVREPREIGTHLMPHLAAALRTLKMWKPEESERPSQRKYDVARAAQNILLAGERGVFADGHRVLWFDPPKDKKMSRVVGTDINLSAMMGQILHAQPFAMVSATIPSTLSRALGVPEARFIDVGHPFDYARQAAIGFSALPGDYRSSQSPANMAQRADELAQKVLDIGGGALLLFSSFRDLDFVYARIALRLRSAGITVLIQERDSDKNRLADMFKKDGNAVLFGSASFATGFDCPGDALRMVSLWKLPYPGLDPVTRAISAASRQRYEDMMLVASVQAIGRLIRTSTDYGTVWVADSRGREKLIARSDPMTAHLREFAPL